MCEALSTRTTTRHQQAPYYIMYLESSASRIAQQRTPRSPGPRQSYRKSPQRSRATKTRTSSAVPRLEGDHYRFEYFRGTTSEGENESLVTKQRASSRTFRTLPGRL